MRKATLISNYLEPVVVLNCRENLEPRFGNRRVSKSSRKHSQGQGKYPDTSVSTMKLYQMFGYVIAVCYLAGVLSAKSCNRNGKETAMSHVGISIGNHDPENHGASTTPVDHFKSHVGSKAGMNSSDVSYQTTSSCVSNEDLSSHGPNEKMSSHGPNEKMSPHGPNEKKVTKRSVNRRRGKAIRRSQTKSMRGRALYGRLGISPQMTGVVFG